MLFESFSSQEMRSICQGRSFLCPIEWSDCFNLLFFQTFSWKVSLCDRGSWRTNCLLLMRKTEACLTSTSPLWEGTTGCQKVLLCIHCFQCHRWSWELNDFLCPSRRAVLSGHSNKQQLSKLSTRDGSAWWHCAPLCLLLLTRTFYQRG